MFQWMDFHLFFLFSFGAHTHFGTGFALFEFHVWNFPFNSILFCFWCLEEVGSYAWLYYYAFSLFLFICRCKFNNEIFYRYRIVYGKTCFHKRPKLLTCNIYQISLCRGQECFIVATEAHTKKNVISQNPVCRELCVTCSPYGYF